MLKLAGERSYDAETRRKKPKYEPSTIEKWRDSLFLKSGETRRKKPKYEHSINRDEGELIDKIERWVEQIVRKTSFPDKSLKDNIAEAATPMRGQGCDDCTAGARQPCQKHSLTS